MVISNADVVRQIAPLDVHRFVLHEARLLNERRFEEWLALLTDDIVYWVPARRDQVGPEREASIFYDTRDVLEARLQRLRHPKLWSQMPHAHAVRLISNLTVDEGFAGEGVVYSDFMMLEYRPSQQKVYGGSCEHVLRRTADGIKIARKTVRLVNCEATLANIAVPF